MLHSTDCSECYLSVGTQQVDITLYLWFKYIFCNTKGWHDVWVWGSSYSIKPKCQLCPSNWTPTCVEGLTCSPCPGVLHERGPDAWAAPLSSRRYLRELASRGWMWSSMAESVLFLQIQMHSHGRATKAFFCWLVTGTASQGYRYEEKPGSHLCSGTQGHLFPTSTLTQQINVGRFCPWACRNCGGEEGKLFSKGDACWRRGFLIPWELVAEYEVKR